MAGLKQVDLLFEILTRSQAMPYIGEKISQLEHALQCAKLASQSGAGTELILGAFLHDIGHLCAPEGHPTMGDYGVKDHESVGALFLASLGFSKNVCELVRGHVQTKRYLARGEKYFSLLSEASKETLKYQGGPMTDAEAAQYEKNPLFKSHLKIRAWDEQAKRTDWKVPGLDEYRALVTESCFALNGETESPG